jgi:hypothetical protein
VADTRLVATLFATGDVSGDGDGDGAPAFITLGVSSRLIVLVSTAAIAGACREFKLITPPRGVGVGIGVAVGVELGVGLGVGVGPAALVVNRSSKPASGLLAEEKLRVLNGWSRKAYPISPTLRKGRFMMTGRQPSPLTSL